MYRLILIPVVLLLLSGCEPENTTPLIPASNSADAVLDTTKATLLKRGTFIGLDGPTDGTASVYLQDGKTYVLLHPFMSHSGPDLYVYLSKDENAGDYIRIGKLRAVTGRQAYAIPGAPAIADYHYVHIWCQAFSVDFARAEIR